MRDVGYTVKERGVAMDQIKIGRFIAASRKEKGLTQMKLAERLGITDKAVSKWERGIAMPDASLMLDLCEVLGISVNELLRGERITAESDGRENEKLLLNMARELEQRERTIWRAMYVLMSICIVGLIGVLLLAGFCVEEGPWQLVVILGACVLFFIPCFYALKLEVSVGAYRCKRCGREIEPTYGEVMRAMHMGTTRYLKCPHCNKRSWCKKVLKKQ